MKGFVLKEFEDVENHKSEIHPQLNKKVFLSFICICMCIYIFYVCIVYSTLYKLWLTVSQYKSLAIMMNLI